MASQQMTSECQKNFQRSHEQQAYEVKSLSDFSSSNEDAVEGIPDSGSRCKSEKDFSSRVTEILKEKEATKICKDIGCDWRRLGRELEFSSADLQDIEDNKHYNSHQDKAHAVLVKFIQKNGSNATKGTLAFALSAIDREDIAEKLIGGEFLSKTKEEIAILKVEGQFSYSISADCKMKKMICRSPNGKLFTLQELKECEHEAYIRLKQTFHTSCDCERIALDTRSESELNDKLEELLIKQQELGNTIRAIQSSLTAQKVMRLREAETKERQEGKDTWSDAQSRQRIKTGKPLVEGSQNKSFHDLEDQTEQRTRLFSEPPPRLPSKIAEEDAMRRRAQTQPVCGRDRKILAEKVSPPEEPKEDDVWDTAL